MKTKRLNRMLSLFLALLLCSLTPWAWLSVSAEESPAPFGSCGKDGENLQWRYDSTLKKLTVSGSGDMADYPFFGPWIEIFQSREEDEEGPQGIGAQGADKKQENGDEPVDSPEELIMDLVVEDGVTGIGTRAFAECITLERVKLADSVEEIRDGAFDSCEDLWQVNIPKKVERIGDRAFSGCKRLKRIELPESLAALGKNAFYCCERLESFTVLNENCDLTKLGVSGNPEKMTVYGYEGSTAEHYAAEFGYPFVPLDAGCHLGHIGDWVVSKAPSCTEPGLQTRICSRCWKTEREELPALGHDYKNGVCTRCGEKDPNWKPVSFIDVPADAYYADAVTWAVNHAPAITNGTGDGKFSPNDPCTRGQVVTFLWRAMGCPEPKTTVNPFTDVKQGAFYYKAVLWAVESGITSGTGEGRFSPDDPCTRGQVVTFLWRTEGKPSAKAPASFSDVAQGAFYAKAVAWAVEQGITKGTGDGKFSPNNPCTRGQVVTFLYRDMA